MKERLIIISDLWGREKSKWLRNYTQILKTKFEIQFYDSCELGDVNKSNYTQKNLHEQFINGGIEKAVKKLSEIEKGRIHIIAFSIGSIIGWNFSLINTNVSSLVCVSSTRLRKETRKPNTKLKLYFGENDEYKPNDKWFNAMSIEHEILPNKGHLIYTDVEFSRKLSKNITHKSILI